MKPILTKVLVTGATGFIGANLIRKLLEQNFQIHILKRKESDTWRINNIISKLSIHNIDLQEKEKLSNLLQKIKPNIIFHLANLGMYAGKDPEIEESLKVNTIGTINLIQAAHLINYDCFVNTGSSAEYGVKYSKMGEDDLCLPNSNYAISKLAATLYTTSYAKKNNKPLVTLRIFSPFGPFDHQDRLISQVISKITHGKKFLCKDPYDIRDYIFIDDVVKAYLLCINNIKKIKGEIINIGSGKQSLIKDIIKYIASEMNADLISFEGSKKHKNVWQADITKADRLLNWQPKTDLYEGLKKTINWFKNNQRND